MSNTSFHPIELPAARLIKQEIELGGPMSFQRFMDLALYHPRYGYYNNSSPRRGRSGDYFTSLQVSKLFPEIFAKAFLAMREALGSEQFSLIEFGSGDGEFLSGVLDVLARQKELKGFRVFSVERSRPARDKLWRALSRFPRTEVVASIDDIDWMGGLEGCLFSNEFFDALPFHRFRYRSGEWREIFVALESNQLVEKEGPASVPVPYDTTAETESPLEGQEIESRPQVPGIFEEWGRWLSRGYVFTVDYGHPRPFLYSARRPQGTWTCFHKHKANQTPFLNLGDQDMTAHIDFTQLAEAGRPAGFNPLLFCSQGILLSHLGQERLETFLKESPPDEQRQRAGQVQQLIHPDSMGESFWTLLQAKGGVPLPPSFEAIPNRLRRLTIF